MKVRRILMAVCALMCMTAFLADDADAKKRVKKKRGKKGEVEQVADTTKKEEKKTEPTTTTPVVDTKADANSAAALASRKIGSYEIQAVLRYYKRMYDNGSVAFPDHLIKN